MKWLVIKGRLATMMNEKPYFYMYDIARGAFLRPDAFKRMISHAAENGFTHFIPYLENMIRLPSMEKASRACAYSAAEWRDFQNTAADAGIELVPQFNVIGHSTDICHAYPELTGGLATSAEINAMKIDAWKLQTDPAFFREIDPTIPQSRKWMLRCLDEFCSFSTAKYFLIGGDEWNTPRHLLAEKHFDPGKAWAEYVNLAIDFLHARGRIPIVWHDLLVHYPSAMDTLSRDAVVAFWHYDEDSGYPLIKTLKGSGFRVIMATGICNGALSNRRQKAFRLAISEAEKYSADGFMVTAWVDGRSERQKLNISLSGQLLAGKTVPSPLLDAVSIINLLDKSPSEEALRKRWVDYGRILLADDVWDEFPECRELLQAKLARNTDFEKNIYPSNHIPAGPLYENLVSKTAPGVKQVFAKQKPIPNLFKAEQTDDPLTGRTVRVYNDGETFVLYPDFGPLLQDWRTSNFTIIPNNLPDFLRNNPRPLPGSYKSHRSPGFQPMWNMGTHLNPSITWQYPWLCRIAEENTGLIVISLEASFTHVDLSYLITVERGRPGFKYNLKAVNKRSFAFGSFGWNMLISGCEGTLETVFRWPEGSGEKKFPVMDSIDDAFWIPARKKLIVERKQWQLAISVSEPETDGFLTDWGSDWMTPDLHGTYRLLANGDRYETEWDFRLTAKE
jgi:hypothetical protein